MHKLLDIRLGELDFRPDSLELRSENLGVFLAFSFHEVALEARDNQVLVHVNYKSADEVFYGGHDIHQRQWPKNVSGKIIARGRFHRDSLNNIVIDDSWDRNYHHYSSIPKEVAEDVLKLLGNHLKANGITFNEISSEVDERVLDKYWIVNGIRSFMTLDDYLTKIRDCSDGDRDLRYNHPLEWKHGLYDNWPIGLHGSTDVNTERVQLRNHLLGKGYTSDPRSKGDLFGTCPVGAVYILFDSYQPPQPYTFGVRLCPRDRIKNRFEEDDSPIWQLQARIIRDIGEYAIDRDLPVFLPKTRPVPTFYGKIPANALEFGVE